MRRRKTSWPPAAPERAQPGKTGGDELAFEQRLQALLESEREAQELLAQLRTERWAAQQKDSERRIASIEKALAGARIEAEKREELEQTLAQVRIEVVRLTIELDKAEQDAEDARRTIKPRAERTLAAAEEALSEARAELKRERAQRAQLEQRVEEFVTREAGVREGREQELDALKRTLAGSERVLAEAQEALVREREERNRERERLLTIESQFQTLVGSEQPGRETESLRLPESRDAEGFSTTPILIREQVQEPSEAPDPPRDGVRRGRRFRRDRRDKELAACLVCKRTVETVGDEADGWIVRADAGLCPDCQHEGWQVAVGGGLPFRRSSDRQTPG